MARGSDIKQSAKNLGLDVPIGDDPAVLADIAEQIGFSNYEYSPEMNDELFSRLKDIEYRHGMDAMWGKDLDGNAYDDDYLPIDEYDDDGNRIGSEYHDVEELRDDDYEEDDDDDSDEELDDEPSDSSDSSDDSKSDKKDKKEDKDEKKEEGESSDSEKSDKDSTDIQNKVDEANKQQDDAQKDGVKKQGSEAEKMGDEAGEEATRHSDLGDNQRGNPNQNSNPNQNGNQNVNNNSNANHNSNGLQNPEAKGGNPNDFQPTSDPKNPNGTGVKAPNSSKSPDVTGNGYNSNNVNKVKANNPTDRAARNLSHNNRAKAGRAAEKAGDAAKNAAKNAGNAAKNTEKAAAKTAKGAGKAAKNAGNATKNAGKAAKNVGKGAKKAADALAKAAAEIGKAIAKLASMIASNPYLLIIVLVIILALIVILICIFGGDGKVKKQSNGRYGSSTCTYNVGGVTGTGQIELSGIEVELVNCQATESNYTVLETIPLERYILGVALAEIGPIAEEEAFKAQLVAVRNFTLTRNSGMCPGNKDNCFYGYNPKTNKIRMRACEADQVYWDYTKDIYRKDEGSISRYSPEINYGTLWKSKLDVSSKSKYESIAASVIGVVLTDENGNVKQLGYKSEQSNKFVELARGGSTYEQILSNVYGSGTFNQATCSSGTINYGDYTLDSSGDVILHESLDSFLSKQGTSLEEFNSLIEANVEAAGYGTRAGVVAAAVTLISELGDNYDVKLPYFWGGGHGDGVNVYAKANWGSSQCHTHANNQDYNYCGLDCSGFAAWAIKNGGFNIGPTGAGSFKNISGMNRVSLSSSSAVLEPGDLMSSDGHVVVIVQVDEANKQYICAEASGNNEGIWFTKRSFAPSGYYGLDLTEFYENSNNVRSK